MSSFKTYIEIEVEVEYDYQPFEAQTRTDPEVYADIECISVAVRVSSRSNSVVCIEDALDEKTMESIKQQCFEDQRTDQ